MKFTDLIEKYKNNTASEEEIELIEQEIEKFQIIEEYLSEDIKLDLFLNENTNIYKDTSNNEKENMDEIKFIKDKVNKKFRKNIIISVTVILLLISSIFLVVSPVMDAMYYNPSAKTINSLRDDFLFDLTALTELRVPGYSVSTILSENLGFGKHNVYFSRTDLFTRESENFQASIYKGRKFGFVEYFVNRQIGYDLFLNISNPEFHDNDRLKKQNTETIEHLKKLNPASYVSASLTFEEDLSMKEIDSLMDKYTKSFGYDLTGNSVDIKWVGVRTSSKGTPSEKITGFNPSRSDFPSYSNAKIDKYPALMLSDWFFDNLDNTYIDMHLGYEEHYKDLLRFVLDRKEMLNTIEGTSKAYEYYKNALEYVETNGVHSFGILVHGNADRIIEFIESENISNVSINHVLAAKPYINLY